MTVSKKLSITQSILILVSFILGIVLLITAVNNSFNINALFLGGGALGVINLILSIAILVIGIIQIVFKVKEETSPVYLAAGICAVCIIIPLLGIVAFIASIVLNIIGMTIKK